jgi:CheY-like chemotaxis protein
MEEKTKILIVDDEKTNIKILLEILEFEDEYITKSASSGEECLAILPEFHPDVILLDIMMPGLDGYEVCRRIKNDPRYNSIKILMLSGRAMQDEIHTGLEAGADQYLSKPFGMDELLTTLSAL